MLAGLGLPAWAQVGDGPLAPMTAPPSIYSSAPPSVAVGVPRMAQQPAPAIAAGAAAPPVSRGTPEQAEAREERLFLRNAAAQSRFELDASRMAFAKSTNAGVRTLAAALINHHNTVGLELAHLLNSRGMAMPMLSNEQSRALKQMGKAGGSKFDALYRQYVGTAQAAVARDYEKAGAAIREPNLNAWIVRQVGNTRFHQAMFERSATDPQLAKWNRTAKPQAKAPIAGVQPVASTGVSRISASNSP